MAAALILPRRSCARPVSNTRCCVRNRSRAGRRLAAAMAHAVGPTTDFAPATAALEMALYDIVGKALQTPVYVRLLRCRAHPRCRAYSPCREHDLTDISGPLKNGNGAGISRCDGVWGVQVQPAGRQAA